MYIKKCIEADIDDLVRVSIQSYSEHYLYLWHDDGKKYVAGNFNSEVFRQQITDNNVALFLIHENKESPPIGFLKLNIDKAYDDKNEKESMELERIYLIKQVSGKGIGSQVLEFAEQFAREKNKKKIWLKVMDSSITAIEFYSRNGYKIAGEFRLTFPEMKKEFRGMHVMMKPLD